MLIFKVSIRWSQSSPKFPIVCFKNKILSIVLYITDLHYLHLYTNVYENVPVIVAFFGVVIGICF